MNCVKSTSVSNEVNCAVTCIPCSSDGVYVVGEDTVTCIGTYYFWRTGLGGWTHDYITGNMSGDYLSWDEHYGFGIIFERYEVGKI